VPLLRFGFLSCSHNAPAPAGIRLPLAFAVIVLVFHMLAVVCASLKVLWTFSGASGGSHPLWVFSVVVHISALLVRVVMLSVVFAALLQLMQV